MKRRPIAGSARDGWRGSNRLPDRRAENFANVVLGYANHIETDILEDTGAAGTCPSKSVWGTAGPGFRDGQAFSGFWSATIPRPCSPYDGQGTLALKPGQPLFHSFPWGTSGRTLRRAIAFHAGSIVSTGDNQRMHGSTGGKSSNPLHFLACAIIKVVVGECSVG
jgi:hypothetical protein